MSQWPFSSSLRRTDPKDRRSWLRGFDADTDDMFSDAGSWNFPSSSVFSSRLRDSAFEDFPRPNMHSFGSGWKNPGWVEEELKRKARSSSPLSSRNTPSPQCGSPMGAGVHHSSSGHHLFQDDGIPIKVVHEKSRSSSRDNTPMPESSCSEPEVPQSPDLPPGIEKHPGVTSKVNAKTAETARHVPKVHHIPIRVEPRDGSEPIVLIPPQPQQATTGQTFTKWNQEPQQTFTESPSSTRRSNSFSNNPPKGAANVRVIPVQVGTSPTEATANVRVPVQVGTSPTEANASVPVVPKEQTPPKAPTPQKPSSPFEVINSLLMELEKFRPQTEAFEGNRSDKEYLYLDEMLTRILIKLDNIITEGNPELRQCRKDAIYKVNQCIHNLESKINSKELKRDITTEEQTTSAEDNNETVQMEVTSNTEEKEPLGETQTVAPEVPADTQIIIEANTQLHDNNSDTQSVTVVLNEEPPSYDEPMEIQQVGNTDNVKDTTEDSKAAVEPQSSSVSEEAHNEVVDAESKQNNDKPDNSKIYTSTVNLQVGENQTELPRNEEK